MTAADAARILELPADATPEQLEARFVELRTRLEDKIAKAPTQGLKAKYRENLDEITQAFETLTLAADSSALPLLQKEPADGGPASLRAAPTPAASPAPSSPLPAPRSTPRKSGGGKEFILVAVVAVLVLGGSGWFILKTRAENAEKARIAAEAKAAAEQKAAADKAEKERLAEESRRAVEAEKARLAAEQKVEQERVDRLAADVRVKLAEAKLSWDLVEREERDAATALSDLKSEDRSARDATPGRRAELAARIDAQSKYNRWLANFIASHPARRAQVRASELLNAKQVDDAAAAANELPGLIAAARTDIAEGRTRHLQLEAAFSIETPPNVAWLLTDAFGGRFEGSGTRKLPRVAIGPGEFRYQKQNWPAMSLKVQITRDGGGMVRPEISAGSVSLRSEPSGATVSQAGRRLGVTPLQLTDLPPGSVKYLLELPDYLPEEVGGIVAAGRSLDLIVRLKTPPTNVVVMNFDTHVNKKLVVPAGTAPTVRAIIQMYGGAPVSSRGKPLEMALLYSTATHPNGHAFSWVQPPFPDSLLNTLVDDGGGIVFQSR